MIVVLLHVAAVYRVSTTVEPMWSMRFSINSKISFIQIITANGDDCAVTVTNRFFTTAEPASNGSPIRERLSKPPLATATLDKDTPGERGR